MVRYGDTMTLTAVTEGKADPAKGFFPLQVDYREKMSAGGKFPGGFIKREGRPTMKETLTSRLIDRPVRPLFPAGYINEVQILCSCLSADKDNDPDVLALIGAGAALHVSHIPLTQIVAGVRVGRVNGELVVMPTIPQLEESDLDLILAGTRQAITMIEGFAPDMLRVNSLFLSEEGADRYYRWIHDQVEAGTPYDQFVAELLTGRGSNFRDGPANYYRVAGSPVALQVRTSPLRRPTAASSS